MSDSWPGEAGTGPGPRWRQLNQQRRWLHRFASQPLAEARVEAPDTTSYLVRVLRNSPLAKPVGDYSDLSSAVAGVVTANVRRRGRTGWRIEVIEPAGRWKAERVLYTQQVNARAIVLDVAAVVANAIVRGDRLWPAKDE